MATQRSEQERRTAVPFGESSPFHQVRAAEGEDSALVRVLMEMDGRLSNIEADVGELKTDVGSILDRFDRLERHLGIEVDA